MAKINWSLASGGNISGGANPKLNPTTIGNTSSLTRVDPVTINPNAGRVQNTPSLVPSVQDDRSYAAAYEATNMLVNAAFRYQDRVDQMEADEAVINYRSKTRELYYGRENTYGEFEGGFGTLERKEALDAFPAYRESLDKLSVSTISGASDSVRGKLILQIQQERDSALERGANHHYQQLNLHEQNIRFQEKQDILKEIELNGVVPFTNGIVQSHLNKYKDADERNANEKYLAQQALFMTYNDAHEKSSSDTANLTPAVTAYKITAQSFEAIRGNLSEDNENYLQNWLGNQKSLADRQAKAAYKAYEARRKKEIDREAPESLAISMVNGNWKSVHGGITAVRSIHKSSSTGSNKVMNILKDGMALAVARSGGVTLSDRKIAAMDVYTKLVNSGNSLNAVEKLELETYATVKLPKEIQAKMDSYDEYALASRDAQIAEALSKGEKIPLQEDPPPNMLDENKAKWYKQSKNYKNGFKGTLSGYTAEKAQAKLAVLKVEQDHRPLTNSEMMLVREFSSDGLVPPGVLDEMVKKNLVAGNPTSKKKPHQTTPAYEAGLKRIETSSFQFAGEPPPAKPKASANSDKQIEYAQANSDWQTKAKLGQAKAKAQMNKDAFLAWKAGKEFDVDAWWAGYVKQLNGGSIIAPGLDTRSWFRKMIEDPSQFKYDVTGDPDDAPSIMY